MILKSIGVWSCARISGAIYGTLGILFGLLFAFLSFIGAGLSATQAGGESALVGLFFGVGAVFILPVFYGVMGLIMGAITAVLYNLFAGMVGGLELDLE